MAYAFNLIFNAIDKISPVLKSIASGKTVVAGLEDSCVSLNSTMSRGAQDTAKASAALSRLSGDVAGAASQSRILADAMSAEAEKMQRAAQSAQIKADTAERMAVTARNHANDLKKELENTEDVTDAMKENASAAVTEAERLEKSAVAARKKAADSEKAAKAAQSNAQSALKAAEADEQLFQSAVKVSSAESKTADALNKAEEEAKQYGRAAEDAAQKSSQLGSSGANAGELLQDAFTTLGVAVALHKIADGFRECINASIEFESAITGVYKTVDGTDEQLAAISDGVKAMSLEMPSSTTEIAGVAEAAGQLGIATDNITDFTEVMINLGEATNLSSDEAASSLAKFANITGMSADNYENLGSSVVALGNNFATTEADIVAMATRMASAGTLAGLTETDILGLAAAMSSVGIEADAGGSAMSTLLSDIQVAVETGSDDLNDFASVADMTSAQFRSAFQEDAAGALYAFIDGLNDVERNGETATVILNDMGITEIRLSNAVKSLASNSGGLADALDVSAQAWEENTALAKEADTRYATLESRLAITKNAANNLKIAIGDVLTPAIGEFADAGTGVLSWLTGFVEQNPIVVEGITGITTATGIAVGTVTAVTVAVKALNTVTKTFNLTLSASQIGIIIGGIAAAGVAIGGLIHYFNSANDSVEDYNGTLEQCRTEIESTQTAYDNVCRLYGSNSEAARNLSSELDTLNAQYEKGGGFVADYGQRLAENQEKINSFTSEYQGKMEDINKDWQSGLVANAQLDALSEKAQLTNSDLDMMSKYADYLNDTFNCNIEVNYDTRELTGFDPEYTTSLLTQKAKENRKQAATETVSGEEFTNSYIDALKNKSAIEEEYAAVKEKIQKASNDWSVVNDTGYTMAEADAAFGAKIAEAQNQLTALETTAQECFNIMGEPEGTALFLENLRQISDAESSLKDDTNDLKESMMPEQSVSDAWSGQAESITQLAEEYTKACDAIREDLDGMFGLFEQANMNFENSVSLDGAIDNLESQLQYFNDYKEALGELSELGVDNSIISQLDPEQAVAFANELGNMDVSSAKSKVEELNESFEGLSDVKDEVSQKLGDIETLYSQKLDDIQQRMENAIDDMNLKDEAAKSAKSTLSGYITELRASGNRAVEEAESIASRITYALNSASGSVHVTAKAVVSGAASMLNGYASGTLSAEPGVALVGENGPELIQFRGGETVYTADETKRIIGDIDSRPLFMPPSDTALPAAVQTSSENSESVKKLSIDINGTGAVSVKGKADKEEVVAVMMEYLKPVLMNIVAQEAFEEGDDSYEI